MESTPSAAAGILQSLRSLGDGLLGAVQERLELFTVELQEEKIRLIQLFIWINAAAFTGVMTITKSAGSAGWRKSRSQSPHGWAVGTRVGRADAS